MLNRSDLEAFDYYDNFEAVKPTPNLDSYTEFVESMILTTGRDRLAENTLGLVGEAGEVAEKIKKHFRDATLDVSSVQKELGDVIFYWVALNNALGLNAMDTILKNMEKLSARQKNGTLRGSGDNR
jgi:NTP pyrophosphatase (non-canonical NTP hydrolase)